MMAFLRILRYGTQGFRRNIWLSVIAIITMTLTLTTMTVFVVGEVVGTSKYQEFNKKIDYIIFLKDSASDADFSALSQEVQNRGEVASSLALNKEDVRKRFDAQFDSIDALKGIVTQDNNPLPREIDVKFHDPSQIDSFDGFIHQAKFEQIIEKTSYQTNKQLISNYVRGTNILKVFGLFFTGFFMVIAVLVILNTIRLAIFSRREEIEIMRLVGATSGYIRGPFLIEGVLFGIIGSLLTAVLFWVLLHQLQIILIQSQSAGTTNSITEVFGTALGSITTSHGFDLWFGRILGLQVGVGLILGILCSFIAVRRYLREQ